MEAQSTANESSRFPRRVLWISASLVLAATIVFLIIAWRYAVTLQKGRELADAAVPEFHRMLNAEQYENIYQSADEGFAGEKRHDELIKFLKSIHVKLGNARVADQLNIRVNTSTLGGSIVAQYRTTFAKDSALETFSWVWKDGGLKLYGYDIRSNALVRN